MKWSTKLLKTYDDDDKSFIRDNKLSHILDDVIEYPISNPYFNKLKGIRNSNIEFDLTDSELDNLQMINRNYRVFFDIFNPLPTSLQRKIIHDIYSNNHLIFDVDRQVGSSTASMMYLLYYIIVNSKKNILFISATTMSESFEKFLNLYKNLPFFIKPGILKFNKNKIVFENMNTINFSTFIGDGYKNLDFIILQDLAFNKLINLNYISKYYNSKILAYSYPSNNLENIFNEIFLGYNDFKKSRYVVI